MNRWWQRKAVAILALGLMWASSSSLQAQYPVPSGHDAQDPTPIAHTPSSYGQQVSNIPPAQLPHGPGPELTYLPHTMYGAFDDGQNCCSAPETYHYFTAEALVLYPHFDRNPAFNYQRVGTGAFGPTDVSFNHDPVVTPRLTLNIQPTPLWGIRGSWWQMFSTTSNRIQVVNTDPNLIISAPETLTGLGLTSPQPFFFFNLLPRSSLIPPITPLPPFPFQNSVAAGFPDIVTAGSSLRMSVFDLEVARYIEMFDWFGSVNMGIRYAYLSQSYFLGRRNFGGTVATPGYDPFIAAQNTGALTVFQDDAWLSYGQNFWGAGPKLSYNLNFPLGDWLKLYTNMGGTVLLGNRNERGFTYSRQTARIFDLANTARQLNFDRTVLTQAQSSEFSVVPMGEFEVGFSLQPGNNVISPILKVGFVSQYWLNSGNATNPNANLFLYGVNATIGFGF